MIDALPESADQTADIQADEKRSRTVSDNMSQLEEEKNDEKVPWADQEVKIIDDHVIILPLKIPILMNKVYQISQHLIFFFGLF